MFGRSIFFRPGQELREFKVLRRENRETENGRIVNNSYVAIGTIRAVLAAARSEEIERWRQLQHKITHKIIMPGISDMRIIPGDVFEYSSRRFYLQSEPYNVGDLNHWTIFYCDERSDTYGN